MKQDRNKFYFHTQTIIVNTKETESTPIWQVMLIHWGL